MKLFTVSSESFHQIIIASLVCLWNYSHSLNSHLHHMQVWTILLVILPGNCTFQYTTSALLWYGSGLTLTEVVYI